MLNTRILRNIFEYREKFLHPRKFIFLKLCSIVIEVEGEALVMELCHVIITLTTKDFQGHWKNFSCQLLCEDGKARYLRTRKRTLSGYQIGCNFVLATTISRMMKYTFLLLLSSYTIRWFHSSTI